MGLLRCGRYDCEHIMCDRMVFDGEMYICDSCYEELRALWSVVSMDAISKHDVRRFIEEFMRSPVETYETKISGIELHDEFNRLVGNGDK
jgi:hypothetical protein